MLYHDCAEYQDVKERTNGARKHCLSCVGRQENERLVFLMKENHVKRLYLGHHRRVDSVFVAFCDERSSGSAVRDLCVIQRRCGRVGVQMIPFYTSKRGRPHCWTRKKFHAQNKCPRLRPTCFVLVGRRHPYGFQVGKGPKQSIHY